MRNQEFLVAYDEVVEMLVVGIEGASFEARQIRGGKE